MVEPVIVYLKFSYETKCESSKCDSKMSYQVGTSYNEIEISSNPNRIESRKIKIWIMSLKSAIGMRNFTFEFDNHDKWIDDNGQMLTLLSYEFLPEGESGALDGLTFEYAGTDKVPDPIYLPSNLFAN